MEHVLTLRNSRCTHLPFEGPHHLFNGITTTTHFSQQILITQSPIRKCVRCSLSAKAIVSTVDILFIELWQVLGEFIDCIGARSTCCGTGVFEIHQGWRYVTPNSR